MAIAAYTRLRVLWGAIDYSTDPESPGYVSGNTHSGDSAGTAALRRAVMIFDRGGQTDDVIQTSIVVAQFDGSDNLVEPNSGNLAALETAMLAFWVGYKINVVSAISFREIRWYREGPGATPPEPVLRVTPVGASGTSGSAPLPGQIRSVLSLRSAYRKRWGRMYLPTPTDAQLAAPGMFSTAFTDGVAGLAHTWFTAWGALNAAPMVYSPQMGRGYGVERVWVDNAVEIQRSGRHLPTYHKSYPI